MKPCTHGMGSALSCVECMEEGNMAPPPKPREATVLATFPAKKAGHCDGCNLPIMVGQTVDKLNTRRVVHAGHA